MRIDNSHQDDAFAATQDAVDERLQEIGNEAESRFAEKEAARQEARIANGYILFASLDLFEGNEIENEEKRRDKVQRNKFKQKKI